MNRAFFTRTRALFVSFIAVASLALLFPIAGFGAEESCPMGVEVSPYQVNIDGGGVSHYVRVLTYARYANTEEAFVYINDDAYPIESEYVELTRDSVGHLIVKIDLDALVAADLTVNDYHTLTVVAMPKIVGDCEEYTGAGEIYIIGKKGS